MNQNFTDLINGLSDGTKDLSISALTCAGNVTLNGNTTIGNASSDTLTVTASVASHVNPSAHNTYDFGTVTTLGWRAFYFASSSATKTAKLQGPAVSSDVTITLPAITGTLAVNTYPTIQIFTSGSGTYTTPAGVRWIMVRMVGGGGGGSGAGLAAGALATAGGNTTFGTSLLTANGGNLGAFGGAGGAGGTTTLNSPAVGINITGASGNGSSLNGTTTSYFNGAPGGSSPLAGGGAGGAAQATGGSASTNSGAGGGGAGGYPASGHYSGSGGGAGGYILAMISSPSASYSYAVGSGGSAGAAGTGTGAAAGGAGGSGYIEVTEYYY